MSTLDTANAARGRWPGILQALGVDPKFLRDVHGPCPMCGGTDRYRFDDKLNGAWICSKCGAGDGFDLLQKINGWDFKKTAGEVDRVVGNCPLASEKKPERSEADKRLAIRRMIEGSGRLTPDTPAGRYLLARCGDLTGLTADLRAHAGIRHSKEDPGAYPALLAIMRYADGKGASLHRTYLTPEGRKAPLDPVRKIMPGSPLEGSSVQLGPAAERMGVAEGIETAICAGHLFGIPVWAAISASGMASWVPPAEAKTVVICADNDTSYTGQAAAFDLGKRLRSRGLAVEIKIPPLEGQDWADVWAQQQHEGVA